MVKGRRSAAAVTECGHVLCAGGLTVGYGDLAAVRDLSLSVSEGEVVAMFGPNGAGKTTTLMGLAGVLPRISGDVRWQGAPLPGSLTRLAREGLMLVPEGRTVTTRLSVRDNLKVGRGGLDAALGLFPMLEPLLDRPGGLLSGGEQQMLVLARALAGRPRALLVDELSLGLAPIVVENLLGALRRAADEQGVAIILVEQQARRALAVADRWYLLVNGTVVQEGDRSSGSKGLESAYIANLTGQTAQWQAPRGNDAAAGA